MTAKNMKVLLVDDDPIFLDFLEKELKDIGTYDVTRAEAAIEAIDIVLSAEVPFDCFLLDIDMPKVDGIELCEMLRGQPCTEGTPIIMVTRLREVQMMDHAFAAGATDYLNKPLVPAELRGRMQMALAKQREKDARMAMMRAVMTNAPMKVSDPTVPDDVPCCVDHLALENYAFRIGSEELCRRTILAVQITNVQEIFDNKDPLGFKLVLNDVAEMIAESFPFDNLMVSYAGNGMFVVMVGEKAKVNLDRIAHRLKELLQIQETRGRATGDILPKLRLGLPVSPTLFACASPDEVLLIAMGMAKEKGIELATPDLPGLMTFCEGDLTTLRREQSPV